MGRASCFSHSSPLEGTFIEYTRGIRGVFTGYTYVSGMYRVCVGYVSGMYRESVERYKERKGFQGHGKRGNNYLLRAEREKSKLSKLQTDYYLQQQ